MTTEIRRIYLETIRSRYRKSTKKEKSLEADTVVHCGNMLAGEFINSLTATDLFSGWTDNRALFRKTSEQVVKNVNSIESRLPFEMKGLASPYVGLLAGSILDVKQPKRTCEIRGLFLFDKFSKLCAEFSGVQGGSKICCYRP